MFTDEELEKLVVEYRIDGKDNQEIVKQIYLMFGGEYHEKDNSKCYYNHVRFLVNSNHMYFVYDTDGDFLYKSPYGRAENVNHWKLKKLIESITEVFRREKERTLRRKLFKIKEDFV